MKNILICGIGGVGGYFGGRIAYKVSQLTKSNYKIYFLARGPNLEEIKRNGLELHVANGEKLICVPNLASDNIKDFLSPDLCIICVKSYDLNDLIKSIRNQLSDNTIIIPLMNGIDIYERIRKNMEKCIVLPTCVYIGSHIESPGQVIQTGNPGFFNCGLDPRHPDLNPQSLISFFKEIGILLNWKDDPLPSIWKKYLLVASFGLVSAHTGQTLGGVINDEISVKLLRKIMREIIFIAREKGIILSDNIVEETIEFCKDYPDVKPSYLRDVEKGKKNEGDLFGGTIIRLGKEFGIPTPTTSSIYKKT